MLRRIQALNYGCLRHVDVALDAFHVLVGPNGSGKSTLFDLIAFARDAVTEGVQRAVEKRTNNLQDLVWGRPKHDAHFELALEFDLPVTLQEELRREGLSNCRGRYELAVSDSEYGPHAPAENLRVVTETGVENDGLATTPPTSLMQGGDAFAGTHQALQRWIDERVAKMVPEEKLRRSVTARISRGAGMLENIHTWLNLPFAETFEAGCRRLSLDSGCLRQASAPVARNGPLEPDGSNLPWAVKRLIDADSERFHAWLGHLRTVLGELEGIRVVEREDDRHAYLMVRQPNGVEVPSWSLSEGTLRLLALTLIAYLPDTDCLYLVEEPENGIHPRAVEAVYQSLSSVYESQVLIASHSTEVLICAEPKDVLCFGKDDDGAARVTPGDRHPRLGHWRNAADVDLFFAPDILE
ncbi:MAG: AAA family ATPase [Gammaproteobacteria bacterium]|nr:AAA family ATPase [Gammaproteobacteria bacterium]